MLVFYSNLNNIINGSFQNNFKAMGQLPFVVYFDYKTRTGDNAFNDKRMHVISYCQIYAFHPKLNLDKIAVYCNFQHNAEEIFDLNPFMEKYVRYFDKITFFS